MYVIKMLCQMFSLSLGAFCLSLKHHSYHHEEFSRKKIGPYLSDSDRKKIAMAKITSDQLRDEVDRFLNDIGDVGNITIGGVPFFWGGEGWEVPQRIFGGQKSTSCSVSSRLYANCMLYDWTTTISLNKVPMLLYTLVRRILPVDGATCNMSFGSW